METESKRSFPDADLPANKAHWNRGRLEELAFHDLFREAVKLHRNVLVHYREAVKLHRDFLVHGIVCEEEKTKIAAIKSELFKNKYLAGDFSEKDFGLRIGEVFVVISCFTWEEVRKVLGSLGSGKEEVFSFSHITFRDFANCLMFVGHREGKEAIAGDFFNNFGGSELDRFVFAFLKDSSFHPLMSKNPLGTVFKFQTAIVELGYDQKYDLHLPPKPERDTIFNELSKSAANPGIKALPKGLGTKGDDGGPKKKPKKGDK